MLKSYIYIYIYIYILTNERKRNAVPIYICIKLYMIFDVHSVRIHQILFFYVYVYTQMTKRVTERRSNLGSLMKQRNFRKTSKKPKTKAEFAVVHSN